MSDGRKCKRCGSELPSDAPQGVCPKCLMALSLGPDSEVASPGEIRFEPPSVEELAAKFPQLEIMGLVGSGGMGAVYKARQKSLNRVVALKILPPDVGNDPAFAERFTREAQALASLSHPNIVSVYDSGQADGLYYFLMEFVDGLNLRRVLKTQKVTPRQALSIVTQICTALQYAHDQGVVHRDIKPENVIFTKKGYVKIADFGLAKLVTQDGLHLSLTGSRLAMGTPHYMAPEQLERPEEVDHRADVYSLGVVFYELLTGELPLGRFETPSQKVQVDVRLDEVVLRALAKDPEQRYQQASQLKAHVRSFVSSKPAAAPTSAQRQPSKKPTRATPATEPNSKRTRTLLVGGAMAMLVLLVGVFAVWSMLREPAAVATQRPALPPTPATTATQTVATTPIASPAPMSPAAPSTDPDTSPTKSPPAPPIQLVPGKAIEGLVEVSDLLLGDGNRGQIRTLRVTPEGFDSWQYEVRPQNAEFLELEIERSGNILEDDFVMRLLWREQPYLILNTSGEVVFGYPDATGTPASVATPPLSWTYLAGPIAIKVSKRELVDQVSGKSPTDGHSFAVFEVELSPVASTPFDLHSDKLVVFGPAGEEHALWGTVLVKGAQRALIEGSYELMFDNAERRFNFDLVYEVSSRVDVGRFSFLDALKGNNLASGGSYSDDSSPSSAEPTGEIAAQPSEGEEMIASSSDATTETPPPPTPVDSGTPAAQRPNELTVVFRSGESITPTAGSIYWVGGKSTFGLYSPRYAKEFLELRISYEDRPDVGELILRPSLSQISSVTTIPGGNFHEVKLNNGKKLTGELLGLHWEGQTTVQGFEATKKVPVEDVQRVSMSQEPDRSITATIVQTNGESTPLNKVRFQVTKVPPGTSRVGNTGIEFEIEKGSAVRFPASEVDHIEILGRAPDERGCLVRVHRQDGRVFNGTTTGGLEISGGVFASGPFKGLEAYLYIDNENLHDVKLVGPYPAVD